jgi:hypothetical protein
VIDINDPHFRRTTSRYHRGIQSYAIKSPRKGVTKNQETNQFVTFFSKEIHRFPMSPRCTALFHGIFPWISAVSIDEPPQAPVPQGRDPRRRGVQRLLKALHVYGIEPSVEVWDFNGGIFGF